MHIKKDTKFLIVGLGLMGGSYAMALSKKGYTVYALSDKQQPLDYALKHKYIDKGSIEIDQKLIRDADIIIFALYPLTFLDWIEENANLISPGTIITDVTGIKIPIIEKIQTTLPEEVEFIASHPMAGKEKYGIENSDDSIFDEANFLITPTQNNTQKAKEICQELGEILGFANIAFLSPEDHDDVIAFLSQLTHCIAIALMNCNDEEHLKAYTGDSFRDLTRIAKINDQMWSELFLLNKDFLLKHINEFENELDKIKVTLIENDQDGLRKMMQKSTIRRSQFDKNK